MQCTPLLSRGLIEAVPAAIWDLNLCNFLEGFKVQHFKITEVASICPEIFGEASMAGHVWPGCTAVNQLGFKAPLNEATREERLE